MPMMADIDSDGEHANGHSLSSSPRDWRKRLKDKAAKISRPGLIKTTSSNGPSSGDSQDVNDFLRPGSSQSLEPPTNAASNLSIRLVSSRASPIPQADRVSRRPSPTPPRRPARPEAQTSKLLIPAIRDPRSTRRTARTLHPHFTNEPPSIIGEGGDESEIPAQDVTIAWRALNASATGPPTRPQPPQDPPPQSVPEFRQQSQLTLPEQDARRASVSRAPTRKPVGGWQQRRMSMNMEEGLVQAHKDLSRTPSNEQKSVLLPHVEGDAEHYGSQEENWPRSYSGHGSARSSFEDESPATGSQPITSEAFDAQSFGQQMDKQWGLTSKEASRTASRASSPPSAKPITPSSSTRGTSPRGHFNLYKSGANSTSLHRQAQKIHTGYETSDQSPMNNYSRDATAFPPAPGPPIVDQSSVSSLPHDYQETEAPPSTRSTQHVPEPEMAEGQEESEDFYARVQHLRGVFRLAADKCADIESKAIEHWLRISAWWFLRGRASLENALRAVTSPNAPRDSARTASTKLQAYVNLAKTWWIVEDVLPDLMDPHGPASQYNHQDSFDGLDYAALFDVHHMLLTVMQSYAVSLTKRKIMPPAALLVQGADPTIWVDAEPLPPGVMTVLADLDPRTLIKRTRKPFFAIPLMDTPRHFAYGRVFGEAEVLMTIDQDAPKTRLPCVISIIRDRSIPQAELAITSPDAQINIHVQGDSRAGPTWQNVEWIAKQATMRIRLSRDFVVSINLNEADFKMLWGIHDYIRRVTADRLPRDDSEQLVYEKVLRLCHHVPARHNAGTFPTVPTPDCMVRLFRRKISKKAEAAVRRFSAGHRLSIITPPSVKTISSISQNYGLRPIMFSNLRGEDGSPAILLSSSDDVNDRSSIVLTFADAASRAELHARLAGIHVSGDEAASVDIPLDDLSIAPITTGPLPPEPSFSKSLIWRTVRAVGLGQDIATCPRVLSDRFRICATSDCGTMTDLVNLGPGELSYSLDVVDSTVIKLWRPAQQNVVAAFAESKLQPTDASTLSHLVEAAAQGPSARIWHFPSLAAMHEFQALATGFAVLFDGHAVNFSISHRRAMVPIMKKTEAHLARLQVLQHDTNSRLVTVFFDDFSLGRSLSFITRATDTCEIGGPGRSSGRYLVKFVDAKFAPPRAATEAGSEFVCLDVRDYASEHDDIVIEFETEKERDGFSSTLAAPLVKQSKMAAVMR